jgi:hypothetical protein
MEFTGENIFEFEKQFPDDRSCLAYLSGLKWTNGFVCNKSGHTKFTIRKKNFARDCNRCHHIESPTAGTIFHGLRFGQRKAFGIMFEMTATTKGISASQAARRYGISRTTAWAFMQRVRSAMQSSKKYPIVGDVQVDEFVFGGKETLKQGRSRDSKKKKIVGAVELSEKGKVKRVYFNKIDDYSSKSLSCIFDKQHLIRCPCFELYTINVDGSGLNRLTITPENEFNAIWRPDGEKIGYLSSASGSEKKAR